MVYAPSQFFQEALNKQEDEVTYIMCSILTFALSLYLPYIRTPRNRKIYATTLGVLIVFYFTGTNGLLPLMQICGTFVIYKVLPLRAACFLGWWYSFSICFGRQCWTSAHRLDQPVDVKVTLMMNFIKLHQLFCNLHDQKF